MLIPPRLTTSYLPRSSSRVSSGVSKRFRITPTSIMALASVRDERVCHVAGFPQSPEVAESDEPLRRGSIRHAERDRGDNECCQASVRPQLGSSLADRTISALNNRDTGHLALS